MSQSTFGTIKSMTVGGKTYKYHCLKTLEAKTGHPISRLPYSLRILIENLLRQEDGDVVKRSDIEAVAGKDMKKKSDHEIQFMPARVLLQDFTGVPVVADLAAVRDALEKKGGTPAKINPLQPVDLVIDHSVQVDKYGTADAFQINSDIEFERNKERYEFLKWGQQAFKNFQVVPPATGICHQVNLEFLGHVAVAGKIDGDDWAYPDTLVGTDSHTTMINGLGVLGWGVGGIEAEAAMLGQPCSMLIPQVVGFELKGELKPGVTATDLVLTVTQMLRKKGVVGKFVEFYGSGVSSLSVADRATLGNMAPEYGATIGIFPVDEKTIEYLKLTGRTQRAELAEAYHKAQGLWASHLQNLEYSDTLALDLSQVEPSMAGPAKPHDRSALNQVSTSFKTFLSSLQTSELVSKDKQAHEVAVTSAGAGAAEGQHFSLGHGAVVIAAITSCTNTSNPDLMVGAALLARNAARKGLQVKPWVKTSFAPGSKVVPEYLKAAGIMLELEKLHFNLVGFGCTTCIGNTGPLPTEIGQVIEEKKLAVAAVLSGNRNFEARIHPLVRANYLASPPLVVAYALAGRIDIDLTKEPLGKGTDGKPVYLADIWPDKKEVQALVAKYATAELFKKNYSQVFKGDVHWQNTKAPTGETYSWSKASTYVQQPPFLDAELTKQLPEIRNARVLGYFGDFITTDHISPAGNISAKSPAGQYLISHGVAQKDFNSYGSRRGNHEVMMRGTFANVRIKNKLVNREGGYTKHFPDGAEMTIFEASQKYEAEGLPLIILAGKEYGSGSSRDWAAKGTRLLGARAVIAESFERIHRSNLIGMGVLPLQFLPDQSAESLGICGDELFTITGLNNLKPQTHVKVTVGRDGKETSFEVICRLDTPNEIRYYESGGILPFVLKKLS